MTEIRPIRAADASRLSGLLAQLGYPSELDAVTGRLAGILNSASQQILVATDGSRVDGYIGVERRLTLRQDEHVEITDLLVNSGVSGEPRRLAGPQLASLMPTVPHTAPDPSRSRRARQLRRGRA